MEDQLRGAVWRPIRARLGSALDSSPECESKLRQALHGSPRCESATVQLDFFVAITWFAVVTTIAWLLLQLLVFRRPAEFLYIGIYWSRGFSARIPAELQGLQCICGPDAQLCRRVPLQSFDRLASPSSSGSRRGEGCLAGPSQLDGLRESAERTG